jgi:hypothetical protein
MFFFPEINRDPVQPLIIFLDGGLDSGKVFADFSQKKCVYMRVCGEGVGKSAGPITNLTDISNRLVIGIQPR